MLRKILFIFLFSLVSCSLNEDIQAAGKYTEIEAINSYTLSVPEPSGLSLHTDGKSLWTVSDQTGMVYQISLDGVLLKTLSFRGEDLEGITQSPIDNTLWVVEERLRALVQIDTNGKELSRSEISVEINQDNCGLEGVVIHPQSGLCYIVNEKQPQLLLRLNAQNQIEKQFALEFSEDCSGITFEENGNYIWLLSDESRLVMKYDLNGNKNAIYSIDIDKAEGIAVNAVDSLIYIVSDSQQELYQFKMP